jgi:hypothetical protein
MSLADNIFFGFVLVFFAAAVFVAFVALALAAFAGTAWMSLVFTAFSQCVGSLANTEAVSSVKVGE